MAKTKRPETGKWVVRSEANGRIVGHYSTREEAVSRGRFLAVASLAAVPKKSKLTQSAAKQAVRSIFKDVPTPAPEA